jgi:hypothetical protein
VKSSKYNQGISPVFILVFIAVILAGAFFLAWKNLTGPIPTPPPLAGTPPPITLQTAPPVAVTTSTPVPTIYPLIPDAGSAGTYNVSQGPHSGPTFRRVVFDPLDVKKGQDLKITVTLESNSGVTGLTGSLTMDNSKKDLSFTRVSDQGATEVWEATFNLTDSVDYKYILNLSGRDAGGTSTISVAPRS